MTAGSTSSSTTTTALLADVAGLLHRPEGRRTTATPASTATSAEQGFRDVSLEVGLDRPIAAMGANFGDIDNDGYLDAYFGTGQMSYSGLVPNVMFKNVEGRRFEDVTDSSRTGHLQKGHGVSFADWDCDGDLDLFVVLGGAYPGRPGVQRPVSEPRPRPPLAEGQAHRHQDQPLGHGGQDPRRPEGTRRRDPVDLSRRSATTAASAATPWSRRSAWPTPSRSPG